MRPLIQLQIASRPSGDIKHDWQKIVYEPPSELALSWLPLDLSRVRLINCIVEVVVSAQTVKNSNNNNNKLGEIREENDKISHKSESIWKPVSLSCCVVFACVCFRNGIFFWCQMVIRRRRASAVIRKQTTFEFLKSSFEDSSGSSGNLNVSECL